MPSCVTASRLPAVMVALPLKLLSSMRVKSVGVSSSVEPRHGAAAMHLGQQRAADRHRRSAAVACSPAGIAAAGRCSRAASPRYRARPEPPPRPARSPASGCAAAGRTSRRRHRSRRRAATSAERDAQRVGIAAQQPRCRRADAEPPRRRRHARPVRLPQRCGAGIVGAAGEPVLERGQRAMGEPARGLDPPPRRIAVGQAEAAQAVDRARAQSAAREDGQQQRVWSGPGSRAGRSNKASARKTPSDAGRRPQRRPEPLPAAAASRARLRRRREPARAGGGVVRRARRRRTWPRQPLRQRSASQGGSRSCARTDS